MNQFIRETKNDYQKKLRKNNLKNTVMDGFVRIVRKKVRADIKIVDDCSEAETVDSILSEK